MPRLLRALIALCLAALQLSAFAPQSVPAPSLSPAAQQQKYRVAKIGVGNKLTIHTTDGTEYHGRLESVGTDTLTLQEVDLKREVAVRYADVVKVDRNYGGKGVGGRRVNPRRSLIVVAALGVVLIVAIILAAKS